jgi:DNA polymerase-3 subunit delta'
VVPVEASIALFQRWAWDLLAYRLAGTVRYHASQRRVIAALAENATVDALLQWARYLASLRATQDHPLNPRLVVEGALLHYAECLGPAPGAVSATGRPG